MTPTAGHEVSLSAVRVLTICLWDVASNIVSLPLHCCLAWPYPFILNKAGRRHLRRQRRVGGGRCRGDLRQRWLRRGGGGRAASAGPWRQPRVDCARQGGQRADVQPSGPPYPGRRRGAFVSVLPLWVLGSPRVMFLGGDGGVDVCCSRLCRHNAMTAIGRTKAGKLLLFWVACLLVARWPGCPCVGRCLPGPVAGAGSVFKYGRNASHLCACVSMLPSSVYCFQ